MQPSDERGGDGVKLLRVATAISSAAPTKENREKQEEQKSTGAEITKSKQRHIPSPYVCGFNSCTGTAGDVDTYKFSTLHSALFFLR